MKKQALLYRTSLKSSLLGCVKTPGLNDRKASRIAAILRALRSFNRGSFHISLKGYFSMTCGIALSLLLCGCGRNIRTAEDVTPGNAKETCMSWKYGATDIRIQTTKITKKLVDRWVARTKYDISNGKPRIIVTHIDNRTDMVISNDMIRDIIEHAAVDDGRITMVVGDTKDEQELDTWLKKITKDPKYSNKSRVDTKEVQAPQFLAKIRIVKAMTELKRYDIEEYLMTLTLYDLETQEIVDSATDILRKKVQI